MGPIEFSETVLEALRELQDALVSREAAKTRLEQLRGPDARVPADRMVSQEKLRVSRARLNLDLQLLAEDR